MLICTIAPFESLLFRANFVHEPEERRLQGTPREQLVQLIEHIFPSHSLTLQRPARSEYQIFKRILWEASESWQ